MAVKGKQRYMVYLDQESVEYVRSILPEGKGSGGLSRLVDSYIMHQASVLRASAIRPGVKVTPAKAFRAFIKNVVVRGVTD